MKGDKENPAKAGGIKELDELPRGIMPLHFLRPCNNFHVLDSSPSNLTIDTESKCLPDPVLIPIVLSKSPVAQPFESNTLRWGSSPYPQGINSYGYDSSPRLAYWTQLACS